MDDSSGVPDPVVIGQDEQTEVHVQPMLQSGRRHLDIRTWRRGPSGFAPSRNALTVEALDLDALQAGIVELLEASQGGHQVARVVWENGDGRRLRAETEPFGTRHMARLGFWQRVRDTWRPADDGLILPAERLHELQGVLRRFRPWVLEASGVASLPLTIAARLDARHEWPAPGADWLTAEPDRIAFHPRGVRITCAVAEQRGRHVVTMRQWRREDSIWLPEPTSFALDIGHLDALLSCLGRVADADEQTPARDITCPDGTALQVRIVGEGPAADLQVEGSRPKTRADEAPLRLAMPAQYLPRFGRLLVQSWLLLLGSLSDTERLALQSRLDEADLPATMEESRIEQEPVGEIFHFGADSETPGLVVSGEGSARIVVEGFLLPSSISLSNSVVADVIAGLEELESRGLTTGGTVVLAGRPECAVHAHLGTVLRPDAIELRVWRGPNESEAIVFETRYLSELTGALRQVLRSQGLPEPASPAPPPEPEPPPPVEPEEAPPSEPVASEAVAPEPAEPEEVAPPVPLGEIALGHHCVSLLLTTRGARRTLSLHWEEHALELPVDHLEELLSDLRSLYYDALRGRRGRTLTVDGQPPIQVMVRNYGTQMYFALESGQNGTHTSLSFPASEVPAFLNTARAALATVPEE